MKILFLTQVFPLPPDSGGKIYTLHEIRALAREHEVSLLTYVRPGDDEKYIKELEKICCRVKTVKMVRNKFSNIYDAAKALITNKSFIIQRDYRHEMQKVFDEEVRNFAPDVVHIDHLQMAQFADMKAGYKTILSNQNVEAMIVKRIAEAADNFSPKRIYGYIEWKKLFKYELDTCKNCDVVITVSDEDTKIFKKHLPDSNINTIPIPVDMEYFKPVAAFPGKDNILSLGTMHWPPNVDAMHYFCESIFPIILKKRPNAKLIIAGQKPVSSIRALACDNIDVTGYVADAREISAESDVFIVPLRSGSGMRVKILNAFAMGLAVVSTTIGAEGIGCKHGEHIIIADTPQEFADAVCHLLENPQKAKEIGKNAYKFVCDNYSSEIIEKKLLSLYKESLESEG